MSRIDAFSFYDDLVAKSAEGPGDYVGLHWRDGGTAFGMIEGAMLTKSEAETEIAFVTSRGVRFTMRAGDEVEIITPSPRRR
jgi:hypothetical protein